MKGRRRGDLSVKDVFIWVIAGALVFLLLGRNRPNPNQPSPARTVVPTQVTDTPTLQVIPASISTRQSTNTFLPPSTPLLTQSITYMWTRTEAKARECARLNCSVVTTLKRGAKVEIGDLVEGDVFGGSADWYEVILGERVSYVHSSLLLSENSQSVQAPQATEHSVTTQPRIQPTQSSIATNYPRPRSCATAVAYGLGGEEIAQRWPHLDRDKDGSACYGT